MNIFQGMSALMCLLTIAKEFGEHHFHELSGKTDIPSLGMIFFVDIIVVVVVIPTLDMIFFVASEMHCSQKMWLKLKNTKHIFL